MKIINYIKNFLIGTVLLIIAVVLIIPLGICGFIAIIISLFYKRHFFKGLSNLGNVFISIATGIDMIGNVLMQELLNWLCIKPEGYQFGDIDETISEVLGVNQFDFTLKPTGKFLCKVLDWLDPDHCYKAAKALIHGKEIGDR